MSCVVAHLNERRPAIIRNVSLGGALVDNMPSLARLTPVRIEMANGRVLTAKVMWSRNNSIGVKFDQQLPYNDPLITLSS